MSAAENTRTPRTTPQGSDTARPVAPRKRPRETPQSIPETLTQDSVGTGQKGHDRFQNLGARTASRDPRCHARVTEVPERPERPPGA
eukprot:3106105-Pyramimonas_sp.AAC.1